MQSAALSNVVFLTLNKEGKMFFRQFDVEVLIISLVRDTQILKYAQNIKNMNKVQQLHTAAPSYQLNLNYRLLLQPVLVFQLPAVLHVICPSGVAVNLQQTEDCCLCFSTPSNILIKRGKLECNMRVSDDCDHLGNCCHLAVFYL